MPMQIVALLIFVGVFVLATLRKVHLGVIMFAAAAGVGIWMADMEMKEVVSGFPISILVLLAGVTYFFAIAQANGTVDNIINTVVRAVGHRAVLLPFVMFGLTTGISAMGAPLAGLVMLPIAMPLAKKYDIDRLLMGVAVGSGVSAGGFAPTSLFGIVTYGTAHSVGIELNPLALFAIALAFNVIAVAFAFFLFGGARLLRSRRRLEESDAAGPVLRDNDPLPAHPFEREGLKQRVGEQTRANATKVLDKMGGIGASLIPAQPSWNVVQIATALCMLGLVGAVIGLAAAGMEPDIGVLCFAFGAVMTLIDPATGKSAVAKIDWSTILMVGGIITFVGVLQEMGAVDLLGEAAAALGAPLIAAFVLCAIGGLISAFASTTGMLAALVPLAIPLVSGGDVTGWAVIAALGICSSIVDLSPFSTVGATVVATVDEPERPRITRALTWWGMSMVLIGPIVLVGGLVLPTSL